jgi:hypothetical protein
MTIDNRCSNVELISPIYFAKDAVCRIQFPQHVNSKSTMKNNIITGMNRDTFGGFLLYHLRGKENNGTDNRFITDKDTSMSTHLLVIWGCKLDWSYSHAYLIKHENTFTWNEDRLERLYDVYNSQYNAYSAIAPEAWLLDDNNTMLEVMCRETNSNFEIVIIISEEEYETYPIRPLWVNPNR